MPSPSPAIALVLVALWASAGATFALRDPADAAEGKPPVIHSDTLELPERVRRMRGDILEAARSGDIEAMRPVLESNELMPLLADGPVDDPIAYWREISADGEGRDILEILRAILGAGYVRLNAGKPDEIFVWPYFAEVPLAILTPDQQTELARIVPAGKLATMQATGTYGHYRLGIGRDGTWHYFVTGN